MAIDRIARHHVVGVDEVEVRALGEAVQQRRPAADRQLVPAHVRHLDSAGTSNRTIRRQDAQPFVRAAFVADIEQQLQPQADAQKRLVGGDRVFDRADQIAPPQFGDGVFKRADAGQNDFIGRRDLCADRW